MTDVQYSTINYKVVEDVPSSGNYGANFNADHADQGSKTWTGTAFWNHDST